ncbi:MAG: hypothetical protein OXF86_12195, partial [Caldilineaceae bacterium]|nr:hypothetical protein [Caldilineaceae bacterium]
CCRRGGVAGAEPPHKGGPTRPDRRELQWSVVSGQWSDGKDGALRASELIADWIWLHCYPRDWKIRPNIGMHSGMGICLTFGWW